MQERTSEQAREKIAMLIVDDSLVFLKSVTRFLQEHDKQHGGVFEIARATSGSEAVHLAEELRPRVVLLDQNMPGLSGLDTIPRLRTILPDVCIIMLTLQNSQMLREQAMQAGADDFVAKLDLPAELIPTIWRHLRPGSQEGSATDSV